MRRAHFAIGHELTHVNDLASFLRERLFIDVQSDHERFTAQITARIAAPIRTYSSVGFFAVTVGSHAMVP